MLNNVIQALNPYPLENRNTAEILLAHVLNVNRAYLHSYPELTLTLKQQSLFETLMARFMAGEPLAYILKRQAFWSIDLYVTPASLIPRPDTELLVELVLQLSNTHPLRVADLGTGSGAIALALAKERPYWEIYATDVSIEALAIAKRNAKDLFVKNVTFSEGNWCDALPKCLFDIIVSNPPYVAKEDSYLDQSVYDYEPHIALFSDENGLSDITKIITESLAYLKKSGCLIVEHGFNQGEVVRKLFAKKGYTSVKTHLDLAGKERATLGIKI